MPDDVECVKKAKPVTQQEQQQLYENVRGIIGEVRNRGDAALHDFSMKFDKIDCYEGLGGHGRSAKARVET